MDAFLLNLSEEPEFDKAEFDKFAKELTEDTYRTIGKCITGWAKTESFLVSIAAMMKAGCNGRR